MVSLLDSLQGIKIETPTGYRHKGAFSRDRMALPKEITQTVCVTLPKQAKIVEPKSKTRELNCKRCDAIMIVKISRGCPKRYCDSCKPIIAREAQLAFEDRQIALGNRRPRGAIGRLRGDDNCSVCRINPRAYPNTNNAFCKSCINRKRRELRARRKQAAKAYIQRIENVTKRIRAEGISGTDN